MQLYAFITHLHLIKPNDKCQMSRLFTFYHDATMIIVIFKKSMWNFLFMKITYDAENVGDF